VLFLGTGLSCSHRRAKLLLRTITHRTIDDALIEDTARCIAELRATPEAKEGVGAFLDKRDPGWRS